MRMCILSYKKICAICGIEFDANTNAKYCSEECKKIKLKEYNAKFRKNNKEKIKYNNLKNKEKAKKYRIEYYKKNSEKIKKRASDWIKNNKEKARITHKNYYENNKERLRILNKKNYEKNKEHISKKNLEYARNHKKQRKQINKRYGDKNREKLREYNRLYRENNKEKIREKNRKYKKQIHINLKEKMGNSIICSLKRFTGDKRKTKTFKTFELLDYNVSDLKLHLELKFQDGMSWDNYNLGGWHIDHIKPVAAFKLIKDNGELDLEQIKLCWSLDNLQPLWASENISKGSWYEVDGNLCRFSNGEIVEIKEKNDNN